MENKICSLSFEHYQAAEGVNVSSLKWISPPEYTPAHYRAKFITEEMEKEDTEAQTFGKLFHRCILEPDTMDKAFWVTPDELELSVDRLKKLKSAKPKGEPIEGKIKVEWNGGFSEAEAWEKEHSDRPILPRALADSICKMRDAVWRHAGAKALLTGARSEACLFAKDSDGTLRKGRLDAIPRGGNAIPDLKSIRSIDDKTVRKTITERRWYCQGPFYSDLCDLCGIDRSVFTMILVEKTPPYLVSVRPLDEFAEKAGRAVYQADLARLRNCLETNQWAGDPNDGSDVGLTSFMQSQLEREGI